MYRLQIVLILLALVSAACCYPRERAQPAHPEEVSGWKDNYRNGVHTICSLLLNKGESSDNGKIGVTVVDIIPPDPCAHHGTYHGSPRAILRLFRASDKKTLCEVTLVGEGGNLVECDPASGISGIGVSAINTKDEWIHFTLMK